MKLKQYITAWFMLLLFVAYQIGVVCFPHVHMVNGAAVVHSHLYADADHDHTTKQVDTLDCICHFLCSEVATPPSVELPIQPLLVGQDFKPVFYLLQKVVRHFDLRGPPQNC